ncbi:hypothetical protein EDEG_02005 [Edhazardia aedis USNM 41457]|uniref:Small ribosomal subunit protein eS1 n=1 Tax=Edhazardia aedis (strain USNM 41457) TaxID=1003232 RepID=J9DM54_EDHAE|nr:hypothetical protein EDEG_02005 [Edhazardia aedis USNM 41457]|eukprot:EJW03675.1 hypothetical protein EDEG_02005 [Edhazardia aedis USNM 41457]
MAIKGAYVSKKTGGGKKGARKKVVDTFSKKEWFNLRVPSIFTKQITGKTLVTRTTAKQNVEKLLIGRCFESNQADLFTAESSKSADCQRCFKFLVEDVRGKDAISTFNGMKVNNDKLRGFVKKWHTLIEGNALVKTTDNYLLRVFVVGQSRRVEGNEDSRVYIQTTKVKAIRKKMFELIDEVFRHCDINEAMDKMCSDKLGKEIEKQCSAIFPLQNCMTTKVMVVKRPKYVPVESDLVLDDDVVIRENLDEDLPQEQWDTENLNENLDIDSEMNNEEQVNESAAGWN